MDLTKGLASRPVDQTRRPKGTAIATEASGQPASRKQQAGGENGLLPSPSISIHPSPTRLTFELGRTMTCSRANVFMAYRRRFSSNESKIPGATS